MNLCFWMIKHEMSPIQIFINRVLTKLFLSTFVQLIYIIFNELFQSSVLLCKFSLKTKKKDSSSNKRKMSKWNKLGRACYKIIDQPHATDHRQPINNPPTGCPLTHQPTDHITADQPTDHRPPSQRPYYNRLTDHWPPTSDPPTGYPLTHRQPTTNPPTTTGRQLTHRLRKVVSNKE